MKIGIPKNIGPLTILMPLTHAVTWEDASNLIRSEYEGWKLPNLRECTYILEMKEIGICDILDSKYWTGIKSIGDIIIFTPGNKPAIFSFSKTTDERRVLLIKHNW